MRAASGRNSSAEPPGRTVCTERGVNSTSHARRCSRLAVGPASTRSAPVARAGSGAVGGAGSYGDEHDPVGRAQAKVSPVRVIHAPPAGPPCPRIAPHAPAPRGKPGPDPPPGCDWTGRSAMRSATADTGAPASMPTTATTTSAVADRDTAGGGNSCRRVASPRTSEPSTRASAILSNWALLSRTSVESRTALIEADRGAPVSRPSSPITSPRPNSRSTTSPWSTCRRPLRTT